MLKPNLCS